MTYPLIQRPAPMQQLAETLQAIVERRRAQQLERMQMELGQAQLAQTRAGTEQTVAQLAEAPIRRRAAEAGAAANEAQARYYDAQAVARLAEVGDRSGGLNEMLAMLPEDARGPVSIAARLRQYVSAEVANRVFGDIYRPSAARFDAQRYHAFMSNLDLGMTAQEASESVEMPLPRGFQPGFRAPKFNGAQPTTGTETWDRWLRRNESWVRGLVRSNPNDPTMDVSPQAALEQARQFFVQTVTVPAPSPNLAREAAQRQAQRLVQQLQARGLTPDEIQVVLQRAGWIGAPTPTAAPQVVQPPPGR